MDVPGGREEELQTKASEKIIQRNIGEYHPQSKSGKRLLAHELTHMVQQRHGKNQTPSIQRARLDCTSRKIIDVYIVNLPGASSSLGPDITFANSVLCQCGIELNVTGGESWATNVLDQLTPAGSLNHSPSAMSKEVRDMTAYRPGGNVIHIYNVPAHDLGWRGGSYGYTGLFPTLPPSVFVTPSRARDTLAHEIGHVLLQDGGHHAVAVNLMATGSNRSVGIDELTPSQCNSMP